MDKKTGFLVRSCSQIFLGFLGLTFISFVNSCAYYNEKNPPDPSTIDPQRVSWQRVSTEFFQPRCAVCHGQGGANVDINDYSGVVSKISRIQQQVLVKKSMPPDSPLTAYEEALLTTWINRGTPLNAPGGGS